MKCIQCGYENTADSKFCRNCGQKVEVIPEYSSTPPQVSAAEERVMIQAAAKNIVPTLLTVIAMIAEVIVTFFDDLLQFIPLCLFVLAVMLYARDIARFYKAGQDVRYPAGRLLIAAGFFAISDIANVIISFNSFWSKKEAKFIYSVASVLLVISIFLIVKGIMLKKSCPPLEVALNKQIPDESAPIPSPTTGKTGQR